jgi:hypothetical protein
MTETEVLRPDGTRGPAATLPDPFAGNCWVDMIYHLRASSQGTGKLRPDGLLEVWANGAAIAVFARARWLLQRRSRHAGSLLQIRPVPRRDYSTTVYFDSFTRGSSYTEVDPAHFPSRRLVALCG